jgi:hypothetical protein
MSSIFAETDDTFPLVRFEASKGTKIAESLHALVFGASIFAVAIMLSTILGLMLFFEAKVSLPIVVAVVCIVMPWSFRWCWKLVAAKLRFCVIFSPKNFQVGRWLVKCVFAYENVAQITVPLLIEGGLVEIRFGPKAAYVRLPINALVECSQLLRRCCGNAVFVDCNGKAYLPSNPTHPERSLVALKKHYLRETRLFIFCGLYCMAFLVGRAWVLLECWRGNINLDNAQVFGLTFCTNIFAIGLLAFMRQAWKSWKAAITIGDRLKCLCAEDPSDVNKTTLQEA